MPTPKKPDSLTKNSTPMYKEQLYRWVKASEVDKIVYRRKYYARWSNDDEVVSTGWFQENDGTFFWNDKGYIPVLKSRWSDIELLEPIEASGDAEKDKDWMDDSIDVVSMNIGRLEINCFDDESEMSIKVGRSGYQSLNMDEAKELANFIISHIKIETDSI